MFAAARRALHNASTKSRASSTRSFQSSSLRSARVGYGRPNNRFEWFMTPTGKKVIGVGVGAGGGYYLYHLEKIPETGRWRFMDISSTEETKLAEAAHSQLINEYRGRILPPNHPLVLKVTRMVSQILSSNSLGSLRTVSPSSFTSAPSPSPANKEWNLLVVDDPGMVNAFATWGNIVLFTGLLPLTGTDDGLASVLGHEIAHATLRHPSENLSGMKVALLMGLVANAVFGVDMGIAQGLYKLGLDLPMSRKKELEADRVGLLYSAKACYDPSAATTVQRRLASISEDQKRRMDLPFLSTHPTGEQRVKLIESLLPEAYNVQAENSACGGTYGNFLEFQNAFAMGDSRLRNRQTDW